MVLIHSIEVLFNLEPVFQGPGGGGGCPSLNHRDRGPLVGPEVRGAVERSPKTVSGHKGCGPDEGGPMMV